MGTSVRSWALPKVIRVIRRWPEDWSQLVSGAQRFLDLVHGGTAK